MQHGIGMKAICIRTRNRTPASQVFKAIQFSGVQSGARSKAAGFRHGITFSREQHTCSRQPPQSDVGRAGITRARRRGHLAKSARPCGGAREAISRRALPLGARRTHLNLPLGSGMATAHGPARKKKIQNSPHISRGSARAYNARAIGHTPHTGPAHAAPAQHIGRRHLASPQSSVLAPA